MIIQFFKTPSLNITGITELLHNNPQDILKIVGLTPVPPDVFDLWPASIRRTYKLYLDLNKGSNQETLSPF